MPHAGWHEQNPDGIVECAKTCINEAIEKLEEQGWAKGSVKGIGEQRARVTRRFNIWALPRTSFSVFLSVES